MKLKKVLKTLVQPSISKATEGWWSTIKGCIYDHKSCPALVSCKTVKRWLKEGIIERRADGLHWTHWTAPIERPATSLSEAIRKVKKNGGKVVRCNFSGDISGATLEEIKDYYWRMYRASGRYPDLDFVFSTCNPKLLLQKLKAVVNRSHWPHNMGIEASARTENQANNTVKILREYSTKLKILRLQPWCPKKTISHLDLEGISLVILGGMVAKGAEPLTEEQVLEVLKQCAMQEVSVDFRNAGGKYRQVDKGIELRNQMVNNWLEQISKDEFFLEEEVKEERRNLYLNGWQF